MCPYIQFVALYTLFGCSKKSLNKKGQVPCESKLPLFFNEVSIKSEQRK